MVFVLVLIGEYWCIVSVFMFMDLQGFQFCQGKVEGVKMVVFMGLIWEFLFDVCDGFQMNIV